MAVAAAAMGREFQLDYLLEVIVAASRDIMQDSTDSCLSSLVACPTFREEFTECFLTFVKNVVKQQGKLDTSTGDMYELKSEDFMNSPLLDDDNCLDPSFAVKAELHGEQSDEDSSELFLSALDDAKAMNNSNDKKPQKEERKRKKPAVNDGPKVPCPVCSKVFTDSWRLNRHLEVHEKSTKKSDASAKRACKKSGNANFVKRQCEECGAVVRNLSDHRRSVHTGETPYKCTECPEERRFKTYHNLRQHKIVMHMEKKFICDLCGYKCSIRAKLTEHMNIHNNNRRFVCTVCSKRFLTNHKLNQHKRVHSGFKPHRCFVCGLAISRKEYLRGHLKSRHGIELQKGRSNEMTFCQTGEPVPVMYSLENNEKKEAVKDTAEASTSFEVSSSLIAPASNSLNVLASTTANIPGLSIPRFMMPFPTSAGGPPPPPPLLKVPGLQ